MCVYVYACSCMYKDAHTYTSAHGNTMILNFPKSDLSSAFLFMLLCVCLCVCMHVYVSACTHVCESAHGSQERMSSSAAKWVL